MGDRSVVLARVRSVTGELVASGSARIPRPRRSPERSTGSDAGHRWRGHPLLAGLVRALVFLVPAAAAIGATVALNWGVETPSSWGVRIGWWLLLLAVSTVVATIVERQMRRLMPLAVLLKLTLLFPDEVPSRYRLARAVGDPGRLRELAQGSSPRARAATGVLLRVAELAKHDRHTRGHSERVRVFTDLLAEQLDITGVDRDKLRWASLLHDIGKLQVPARVLNKPGKPTPNEWDTLRKHPATGMTLLGPLAAWLGPWAGGVADHHERFDGTGYPRGLSGRSISLAGRIVAVADSFETMTATRAYKRPMAAAAGREELARCAGTHFDPDVVRAFLAIGLPRMLSSIGPVSFLVHLPFLGRLPEASMQLAAAAGQAAMPVASGLTAATFATTAVVAPTAVDATPTVGKETVAASASSSQGQGGGTAGPAGGLVPRPALPGWLSTTTIGRGLATATQSASDAAGSTPRSAGAGRSSGSGTTPVAGAGDRSTGAKKPKPSKGEDAAGERPAGNGGSTDKKDGPGNNGNGNANGHDKKVSGSDENGSGSSKTGISSNTGKVSKTGIAGASGSPTGDASATSG